MNNLGHRPSRITVITNLNTTNVGNQALSTELMRLVRDVHGKHEVGFLGRSTGLEHYSVESLRRAGSQWASLFDEWAENIIKNYQSRERPPLTFSQKEPPVVNLIQPDSFSLRLEPFKRPLRKVRKGLRSLGYNYEAYEKRLQILESSDLVVYNPAGEMAPKSTDVPMRQLLELRVAQKMGCRVMVVNHSVETKDPTCLKLIAHLYSQFDGIVVREHLSEQALFDAGVPVEKVRVAPDVAFHATPAERTLVEQVLEKEGVRPGTVAVAINNESTELELEGWGKIIQNLQDRGKQVLFVSNCLLADQSIGRDFQRRYGIRVMSQQYDYPLYLGILSGVELVISTRLHTSVFAMLGNTPVLPVELNIFKTTGTFELTDYPVPVVNPSNPDWVESVSYWIDYIYSNYGMVKEKLAEIVPQMRKSSEGNVQWDFETDDVLKSR